MTTQSDVLMAMVVVPVTAQYLLSGDTEAFPPSTCTLVVFAQLVSGIALFLSIFFSGPNFWNNKINAFSIDAQSRFASAVLNGVLGPLR